MSGKALKVVVEIKLRAVSCPGVHLPARDDIYISMCFMGQYRHSESLPAVFPLLFHEKMTFEKIFRHAFDPGDIAVMLEYETVRAELVQLIPPVGDTLASFEEDARSFLFPEPKLVPPFSGVDREVLMMRAPHFHGIAPRLEFSTKTTIVECSPDAEVTIHPNKPLRPVMKKSKKRSSRPRTSSPQQNTSRPLSYSLRSRSLSPLRARNTQDLARLSLDFAAPPPADWDTSISQPVGELSEDGSSSSETHAGPVPSELWRSYREHTRQSSSHRTWEEVHERVRGLLTTPKAVRRLVYGATMSEVEEVLGRRSTMMS
ncbi:spermatogenesis associated 6-like protein isoform X2 [Melanotaenia boesemani]|uniref:spermatogenesis associated 6-like protein isoform X2 n=1 Tax=Melanotaenia boesemani TaxID=1250792 RepID=UPI001C0535D4|nr:spermatogenesis associated 6-like protein isoform X2 [Melanotaenia boesemani]